VKRIAPCRAATLLGVLVSLPMTAAATESDSTPLAPLEVTSPRITAPWVETPTAIGVVNTDVQVGDSGLALSETLTRIPGVYTQSVYNLNQGLRLSIRGFGSRAAFGVRGVRVFVDDIPLTMPDGQTDLDALDLALVEQVEVLRGPASALYGNGAGGVLAITTRDRPENRWGRVDLVTGELGDRRIRGEVGLQGERSSGLISLAYRDLDGHRDNMEADSLIGSARYALQIGSGTLAVNLATLDIDAQDPAALTLAEVQANRRQANPGAINFAVTESIRQERVGLSWLAPLGADTDYRLRSWAGQRDFANALPFANGGQTEFDRVFGGVGGQIDRRLAWGGVAQTLSLGADVETQTDERRRFNHGPGGVRGDQTLDQDERARGVGVYLSNQMVWQRVTASAGLRYDRIRLSVSDRFQSDGDDSGRQDFNRTSVNVGLGYTLTDRNSVFARYGTGFETPTNSELANPTGGGFNPDLGPAEARNVEVGYKFDGARLRTELVFYRIRNKDELVRFELPDQPGRSFFRNAGITDRDGVELSAVWQPLTMLTASMSYSYNDFTFRNYQLGSADFSGNVIPGLPLQQIFTELAYHPLPAWTARLQAIGLDRVFADDANAVRVPGYVVTNARLSWTGQYSGSRITPYVAVNNIFDREYNDNLRVNAGFGRFYEPAPGRVALAGISVEF
jgi:iron complex outermembrane recepter protein